VFFSRQSYQRALALRPSHTGALQNMAVSLQRHALLVDSASKQAAMLDAAAKAYHACIDGDPTNVGAANNLGVLLLTLGRVKPAATALEAVVRLEPREIDAWISLAHAYELLDVDKGGAALARANQCFMSAVDVDATTAGLSIARRLDDQLKSGKRSALVASSLGLAMEVTWLLC
jgi:predicted Zn-dependent protease